MWDKICPRCNGKLTYELQVEDGYQYIISDCPCATERHIAIDFGIPEEKEFITVEEMQL